MDITKPKRRWFQFHLLTAVVMMMVAGTYIWVNTLLHHSPDTMSVNWGAYLTQTTQTGWPAVWRETISRLRAGAKNEELEAGNKSASISPSEITVIKSRGLIMDVFIGIGTLFICAMFSEWAIRRSAYFTHCRAARKP